MYTYTQYANGRRARPSQAAVLSTRSRCLGEVGDID